MKLKYIRCGICAEFFRPETHCRYCGAYRFIIDGRAHFFNAHYVRMARALPLPLEQTIERLVSWADKKFQAENPNAPEFLATRLTPKRHYVRHGVADKQVRA